MTNITVWMKCLAIAIVCGCASACAGGDAAGDVEAKSAALQSAGGVAGHAANEATAMSQAEAERLAGAKGITYYDRCKKAHQACTCQNTGWAGYCGVTDILPDIIVRCICD